MAMAKSTYAQDLPESVLRHRKHMKEMALAATARRQEGKSAGRARNRARRMQKRAA